MENKINVAKLLKDCPMGMELDCLLCNSPIALVDVAVNESTYPIKAVCKDGFIHVLTKYGAIYNHDDAKCVIFPKGKTTWEGFHRPFKDGDIVTWKDRGALVACIYKERKNTSSFYHHIALYKGGVGIIVNSEIALMDNQLRLATEEEKQKLFDAIKANGYKWNTETKTLEKLSKFKVGDRIKYIYFDRKVAKVVKIHDKRYELDNGKFLEFQDENAYEISYDKFDISTLIPFENKVLCRNHCDETWEGDVFIRYADDCSDHQYYCIGALYDKCIPYEGNEHLLGKTNDCDEFYKTWK